MILSKTHRNPYIIGRPIHEIEYFYGRTILFDFIADNLANNEQVILLHGQRRIGKSSVLAQIPNFVGEDEYIFVNFDLQDKARLSLSQVLYNLEEEIIEELDLSEDAVNVLSVSKLEANPDSFSEKFLSQLFQVISSQKLVLLLDEFDVLSDYGPTSAVEHFFPYLKSLLYKHHQLFIIPVVGRQLDDIPNLLELFRAPYQEIGLLNETSARQLITKPAEGILEYETDAIKAILELSAGHPYFTQVICFALFGQAREEDKWVVTRTEVESVLDRSIEIGEAGLIWFRDGLPQPERLIFTAIAELSKGKYLEFWSLLENHNIYKTRRITKAINKLSDWGFIHTVSDSLTLQNYRVKIKLVCYWLVKKFAFSHESEIYKQAQNKQIAYLLQENIDNWNQWRKENSKAYINLCGANLSNTNLAGANLSDADLAEVNFSDTNLNKADLSRADLYEASLIRVQALETNFSEAILTGTCIEDWNINSNTNLKNAECSFVYLKFLYTQENQELKFTERRPFDPYKMFAPGDFERLVHGFKQTIDLIYSDGIDWQAFLNSYEQLKVEVEGDILPIQAIENKGDGSFVIRLQAPPELDKEKIQNYFETQYKRALKIKEQQYRELLNAKTREIEMYRDLNTSLLEIVKLKASQPINISQQQGDSIMSGDNNTHNGEFGIGHMRGSTIQGDAKITGVINETKGKSLAEAATEIQQLLDQLSQTYSLAEAEQKVAEDLTNKAQQDLSFKQELKSWSLSLLGKGNETAVTETVKEAVKRVIPLAISLLI